MIPLLYPPNSLPFSGLYLMIPLFRWSMKISINQRQTFDLKRCMIIFVIVNMYILMQISPFLLYSATVGDGIKCYTVGGQGMPQWSTCHPKLSGYRAVSMSWTQSLFHHCHISHFWNFEHVITQSLVQYCHISHSRTLKMSWTHQSLVHHCHINHSRTLKMSWTHQLLVHNCHVSDLHNFEHVITLAQQFYIILNMLLH